MGHLLDGRWTDSETLTEHKDGHYVKQPSQFRHWIRLDGSTQFRPEKDRYVLYWSMACPWAHRTSLMRAFKKLEDIIAIYPTEQDPEGRGWYFADGPHNVPGTDARINFLHELYTISDPHCTTRVTVPTLWDSHTRSVISNESSDIIRMFNSEFSKLAPPTPDFYPLDLSREIDELNDKILKGINNAVNACGRSTSQSAYDQSLDLLFLTLGELDKRLQDSRFLCGNTITEPDLRLFPTLVRFDAIYYFGYKCNLCPLSSYPNLLNYTREIYQMPGVAAVSDVEEIKRQVYSKAGPIGGNGVIPRGPRLDFQQPHDRERFAQSGRLENSERVFTHENG